jgi:hypothetical protein
MRTAEEMLNVSSLDLPCSCAWDRAGRVCYRTSRVGDRYGICGAYLDYVDCILVFPVPDVADAADRKLWV